MSARIEYRHGSSPAALADLPDGVADAIVTDPPYGTARPGDWHGYGRRPSQVTERGHRGTLIQADTDLSALAGAAPEMARCLAPCGVAIVFCAPFRRRAAEDALIGGGLEPIHYLPWDKGAPGLAYKVRYAYEDAILCVHPGYDPWSGEREPIVVPLREPRLKAPEHPNEKPVALLRRLVRWALPTGGLVLDPFAGIASCGVAAIAERCGYIGVECDPQWWPIAERRLAEAQNHPHPDLPQQSLFGEAA